MRTLIRGGRLVLPEGLRDGELLLEDGRIEGIGAAGELRAERVLDAAGCYVLPGLVDLHVHLDDRIGGCFLADTYESGSRVALQNGVTTLCSFITQGPGEGLRAAVDRALGRARGRTHADLAWHLTPTRFEDRDWAELEALLAAGWRTVKLYTTYREAGLLCDEARMDALFSRLGPLDARFLVHAEDDAVIAGVDASRLDLSRAASHALLRPEEAELLAMEYVAALALCNRVPLHFVHVSGLRSAELLPRWRGLGDVTAETCPQYLWLDSGWLERADGHRWICSPPLRDGREAFRERARAGAFEVFATDHCPFRTGDKDAWGGKDCRRVPGGLPGLGALMHAVWRLHGDDPDQAARELALRCAANPARIAGLAHRKGALAPGLDADVLVLDPAGPERPVRSTLAPCPEPYPLLASRLQVRHLLLRGREVVAGSALCHPGAPTGLCLPEA